MTGGVFTRHDDGTFSVENGVANAIHLTTGATIPESAIETQGSLALAAEEGREIRFNDPITSRSENSDCPMTLTLNRCTDEEGNIHDTDGTIIFSSELYQGEEAHLVASRYNNFVADTTLYGGTLLLEHGAVFGRNLEDMRNLGNDSSSLTVEKVRWKSSEEARPTPPPSPSPAGTPCCARVTAPSSTPTPPTSPAASPSTCATSSSPGRAPGRA